MALAVHGSYPSDSGIWSHILRIPESAARAFIRHAQMCAGMASAKDEESNDALLMNKCFRVIQQRGEKVFAVYNHDGRYWLLSASAKDFVEADQKKYGSARDYKPPHERAPYPIDI